MLSGKSLAAPKGMVKRRSTPHYWALNISHARRRLTDRRITYAARPETVVAAFSFWEGDFLPKPIPPEGFALVDFHCPLGWP